jgi:hypothetical protein
MHPQGSKKIVHRRAPGACYDPAMKDLGLALIGSLAAAACGVVQGRHRHRHRR